MCVQSLTSEEYGRKAKLTSIWKKCDPVSLGDSNSFPRLCK